jgi:hypothetical protein
MRNTLLWRAAAATIAGALVFGLATLSHAAPMPSAVAAVGKAAPSHVIDVQARPRAGGGVARNYGGRHYGGGYRGGRGYYRGGYGYRGYGYRGYGGYGGWGYPFAAGVIAGGLAAGAYPYYYGRPYYYAPAPAPVYVEPGYGPNGPVRQCWVATDKDRGFGYWQPC